MTDTLRRWSITNVSSVGEEHGVPTKEGKWVLYADVERVRAAEAKRVKSYYDSRHGGLQRENAELRKQVEQTEHALAAKEAEIAQLQARVIELGGKP